MYDFKLEQNEEIKLISDNTIIYFDKESKNYTSIITNKRLLILDYPSGVHNSAEDLRISGRMTYIRKKEVISEIYLNDMISLENEKQFYKIILRNGKYLNINDDEIINYLKR